MSVPDPPQEVTSDFLGSLGAPSPSQTTVNIYLSVLQARKITHTQLMNRGFSDQEIETAVSFLSARGLLVSLSPGELEAISPDVSLPAIASQMEARAATVRRSTAPLQRLFLGAALSTQSAPDGMTRLKTVEEMQFAVHQIVLSARTWVIGSRHPSALTEEQLRNPWAPELAVPRGEGPATVQVRVNYSADLLEHPNLLTLLSIRADLGYEQRITRGLPLTAVINDRGEALVEMVDSEGRAFGLIMGPDSGARTLHSVMQWAWQHGVPWTPRRADRANPQGLDDRDQQILQLLAGGATDATISRQTGISQRTVERRIRAIMDRLGASTRFQAGLLAVRDKLL